MKTRKLLTPEEIKEAFERYEDMTRPLILFGSPEDIKLVKEYCPEYSQYFTFKETDQLEPGKLICCKKGELMHNINSNPDLTGWEDVVQIIGKDENNESHDEY